MSISSSSFQNSSSIYSDGASLEEQRVTQISVRRDQFLSSLEDHPNICETALRVLGYRRQDNHSAHEQLRRSLAPEMTPVLKALMEESLYRFVEETDGLEMPNFAGTGGSVDMSQLFNFLHAVKAALLENPHNIEYCLIEDQTEVVWAIARENTIQTLREVASIAMELDLIDEVSFSQFESLRKLDSVQIDEDIFNDHLTEVAHSLGYSEEGYEVTKDLSVLRELYELGGLADVADVLQSNLLCLRSGARCLELFHTNMSVKLAAQVLLHLESFQTQAKFFLPLDFEQKSVPNPLVQTAEMALEVLTSARQGGTSQDISEATKSFKRACLAIDNTQKAPLHSLLQTITSSNRRVEIGLRKFDLRFSPIAPGMLPGATAMKHMTKSELASAPSGQDKKYTRVDSLQDGIALLSIDLTTKSRSGEAPASRLDRIQNEIKILEYLTGENCPNVVQLYGSFFQGQPSSPERCLLFMENCPYGDLMSALVPSEYSLIQLSPNLVCNVLLSLLPTLARLKELRVLHGDFKPDNIIMKDLHTPMLTDFGLSHRIPAGVDTLKISQGTPFYLSPEMIMKSGAGFPSDLYSFASVLFSLLYDVPYHGAWMMDPSKTAFEVIRKLPSCLDSISNNPRMHYLRTARLKPRDVKPIDKLLMKMLHPTPSSRPDARVLAEQYKDSKPEDLL